MSENPYLAPQTFDTPLPQNSDAELIRKEHIKTEASIKSIGILYYLGSIAIVIAALACLSAVGSSQANAGIILAMTVLFLALGIFQFVVGMAVRQFKPWSRIAVGVLSAIGLLGFPLGTLINGYILYLVFSKKGEMVFSAPYQEIIAATPHVKYRTPKAVWIVLGIIVAVIAIGIVAAATGN